MGIIKAQDEKIFENFHQASPRVSKAVCVDLRERESLSELKRMLCMTIPQRTWVCIEYARTLMQEK